MADIKAKTQRLTLVFGAALVLTSAGCAMDDDSPVNTTAMQSCPSWVYFPTDHHSNADSPYLDCLNRLNLVNMLESPADLDQGRPLSLENGERETAVLKDYDQNKGSSFKDENEPTTVPPIAGITTGGSTQ